MLDTLPDHLLLSLCLVPTLSAVDLARLEGCARHFRLRRSELRGAVRAAPVTPCSVGHSTTHTRVGAA
jgi:hypothetical protein